MQTYPPGHTGVGETAAQATLLHQRSGNFYTTHPLCWSNLAWSTGEGPAMTNMPLPKCRV